MEDCTIYENCIQQKQIEIHLKQDIFHMIAVGCWGVYCHNGNYSIPKKKDNKISQKIVQRGQRNVSSALIQYTKTHKVTDMYLVGDNIYQDGIKIEEGTEITQEILEKITNNPYNIEKQIEEGFENCFLKSNIDRFFLTIGNHDIESCHTLTTQHNYSKWNSPSLYYNVIYFLNNFKINIIVLDTNMFEDNPKRCDNQPFTKKQIQTQIDWALSVKNKGDWNIVIGHIPYLANGHKQEKHPIDRPILSKLINDICPQLYICADEHNQQFIQPEKSNTSIVIAGSGGTGLDKDIKTPLLKNTLYTNTDFGFVSYKIDKEHIEITFISDKNKENYKKIINKT